MFSKLDANSGFWQIGLSPESAKLTTFITPFGRFCFNRLPFGISSARSIFRSKFHCLCQMDDILVFGKTDAELDEDLEETLKTLQSAGLTLNEDKCEFSKPSVEFLGTIFESEGIRVDPNRKEPP